MECHWHPGMPGVGYCTDCRVFVCRVCATLSGNPIRCTDCQLKFVRGQIIKVRRSLWRGLGGALVALLVGEWAFNQLSPGLGAILAGIAAAYVIGSLFLGGLAGPFVAPWLIVKDFRRLRAFRQRESLIFAVQQHSDSDSIDTRDLRTDYYPESPSVQ